MDTLPFWHSPDSQPALAVSPLGSADPSADVVVIGLGAGGLSAAAQLAGRGAAVLAVDAHDRIAFGASGRNGGFLLAGGALFHDEAKRAWGDAVAIRLYRATVEEMDHIAARSPNHVDRCGVVRVAWDDAEEAECRAYAAALTQDGFTCDLTEVNGRAGIAVPTDGVLDPVGRAADLAADARSAGAKLVGGVTVTDLDSTVDGVDVTGRSTSGEPWTCRARAVVVAVDGAAEVLLPELAREPWGVRSGRLQMLATGPAAALDARMPVYARHGFEYWQQRCAGEVLLGGFRDRGGDGEWTTTAATTRAVQDRLDAFLADELHVTAHVTHRWAGVVSWSADRLPVVAQVRPRVFFAGAYSGHGNVLSSLCGRLAADAALGDAVTTPWATEV